MTFTEVQTKEETSFYKGSSLIKDIDLESLAYLSKSYSAEEEQEINSVNDGSDSECVFKTPIYLKIFFNFTTITATISAALLYFIYLSHGPSSKYLGILQSTPYNSVVLSNSNVQYPGLVFVGFTTLCIDFDSIIGKLFNDKLFYSIMVYLFMNYMQYLFQNLFAGCGFSDFEGYSIISVFFNTLLCSWLGYFAMKLKVHTGKLKESRLPIKEWFGMMVIFTCYLEICHYLTVNKWQHYQFKWELIGDWCDCKLVSLLVPLHVYSVAFLGLLVITYSISSTMLGNEYTLMSFGNSDVSVMILPIMLTSMLYSFKALTFVFDI